MFICSTAGPSAPGDGLQVAPSGGSGAASSSTSGEKEKEKAAKESTEVSCGRKTTLLLI